jgi:predicted kinase
MLSFRRFLIEQIEQSPKVLFIMRGITGTGKSTMAKGIKADAENSGLSAALHASDDIHMTPPTEEAPEGTYAWDPNNLKEGHRRTLEAARESMRQGTNHVVVDSMNLRHEHMLPYVDAAKEHGYEVKFVDTMETPISREELERRHKERGERIPGYDLSHIIDRTLGQYQPFKGKTDDERVKEVLASRG